jgi:hypothetical protein
MSDNNIVNLKEVPSIIGSYAEDYSVIVDSRAIPKIRCRDNGETIDIILDRRFCYTFPKDLAYLAAAFAAQAMAIGAGYSHLGASNKEQPFAPQVMQIEIEGK